VVQDASNRLVNQAPHARSAHASTTGQLVQPLRWVSVQAVVLPQQVPFQYRQNCEGCIRQRLQCLRVGPRPAQRTLPNLLAEFGRARHLARALEAPGPGGSTACELTGAPTKEFLTTGRPAGRLDTVAQLVGCPLNR
jgi:hypothetical protein